MADNEDALASFMSITGANSVTATQYLDLTNGSLSEAVNLFMESGGQSMGGGGDSMMPPAAPMATSYEDEVRAPDPSKRQRLFGDTRFDSVPIRRLHEQYRDFAAESIAAINASSNNSAISAAFSGESEDSNRTRDFRSLFKPPVDLMFQGTYSEARALAKSEGKWLLVNIQDEIVFASHMLNRDTWSDDVVQNVVASGYIFWQQYWVSEHGKKFCQLYQIDRDHLPIVAIVNPKTGEIVTKWSGFVEAQTLTERLSDFAFTHSYEVEEAVSTGEAQPRQPDIIEASEDDQLAAAIAASLEGGGGDASEESDANADEEEKAEEPAVEEVLAPMPEEPTAGPDVARVQILAPDGRRLTRRYLKTDPVSLIWLFAKHEIPEARTRTFELRTVHPPKAVSFDDEVTVAESQLGNQSLRLQWV